MSRYLLALAFLGLLVVLGCSSHAEPVASVATANAPAAGSSPNRPVNFDWPQWQGPDRTAISRETGLLPRWPKEGPPLVWKARGLGDGYSTPSVAGGRIFTMGNLNREECVLALNEQNGDILWTYQIGPVRSNGGGYPGPRCTPTVDGERVYALGLNGDLVCLKVADGAKVWQRDLRKEFQGQPGGWGYSESPLVDGDRLIVTPGGRTATLAALNKTTGATIWQSSVPQGDAAAYSSIIAADVAGQKQYIQFLSRGVVGVAATDGQFLWRYDRPANGTANCSTPIYHDGLMFAASGYGTGGGLARLTRQGNGATAEQVYFTNKMQNHHGGMVLVDGYLYGSNEGQLVCLEFKTGNVMWEDRQPGKGSIAYADGRLYYRNERGRGTLTLIEATPKGYIEHGRFDQPDRTGHSAWPHPIIANGKLYIRDQDVLLCYDVKAK